MKTPPLTTTGSDGLMIDWIDEEGRVYAVSPHEARELEVDVEKGGTIALERIYSSTSAQMLKAIARGETPPDPSFPVWVNSPSYSEIPMVATVVRNPGQGIAVVKQALSASLLGIGIELSERMEILSQMIGAATDACWCIEFLEPVDISLSEEEIVDSIFKKQSRWRACNDAMARLYRVPPELDFNMQPVARYFPDTEVNREMVRELVRANYRLDRAAAIDRRHDGSEMFVENDFRAAIRDGLLIRLWGTTRDISPFKEREQRLNDRADTMQDILSATPDPILVISEEGTILAANPATQTAWAHEAEDILGRPIQRFVETRNAAEKLRSAASENEDGECDLAVISADRTKDIWRFHASRLEGEVRRYVVTARRKTKRRPRVLTEEAF
ncbi:PAS domain S-box-containing protein [Mycoplana sp. BE70]|uniref:PAS domain-containing protein n=1 Tax=Mycoplana sp. BE70 TaxID=2817775 RepID=UPI00285F49BF|nr:PAS domain-containing protein [Mycoplana sp. BE70]MDR6759139.1 PAS domain S-box-containing protein [Mycoplana sp. BE70]